MSPSIVPYLYYSTMSKNSAYEMESVLSGYTGYMLSVQEIVYKFRHYVSFQNRKAKATIHTGWKSWKSSLLWTHRWVWNLWALWLSLSMCIYAFVWKSVYMWFLALVAVIINPLQNISWYIYTQAHLNYSIMYFLWKKRFYSV